MSGARAQTVYEVEFGQDFFESAQIPGFSLRFYPGSITIHKGDTIHFGGFGAPVLLPANIHPDEFIQEQASQLNDPYFDLFTDPDEGEGAFKFNNALIFGGDPSCGTAENHCQWNGNGNDILSIGEASELFVDITANAGDVIYAAGGNKGGEAIFRINVVDDAEAASTQAELDERAARLKTHDFNHASALFAKYSAKQTKHKTPSGKTVWDAWVGLDRGPISFLAMFPAKLNIKKGQSVQYHFELENEVHNAVFPFDKAKNISQNTFLFVCDPDGDAGTEPDVDAIFPDDGPPTCPGGPSQLEVDLHPQEVLEGGDGTLKSAKDFETSGIRGPESVGGGFWSEDDWTVKFSAVGKHKYGCTIHGPGFMGGVITVE